MSDAANCNAPNSVGLIELLNPQDVSFKQPKTLVDFKIINEMLKKHGARK